ncbi:MAG: elongation factor P maturation arginine rhamnosyltransferase EarP, partial [Limnohabitans sp.]
LPLSYQAALAHCVNARPSNVSASPSGPATRPPTWINLEYLSAETYVERSHGLPSPVMTGPARGLTKWFFYPGFTARTGGLIREPHLHPPPVRATQMGSPAGELAPRADIASSSQRPAGLARRQALRISLFCYEPQGLDSWLQGLRLSSMPIHLWVAAGRPQTAVKQCLPAGHRHAPSLNLRYLPFLTQTRYDHLLRHCDLNVVRGEDSLVRAIWAGRPLIWHIYPQADGVHHDKLDAFLALSQAPTSLVDYHRRWNADQAMPLPALTQALLASWQDWALAWRERLLAQPDLTSQLIAFVRGKP